MAWTPPNSSPSPVAASWQEMADLEFSQPGLTRVPAKTKLQKKSAMVTVALADLVAVMTDAGANEKLVGSVVKKLRAKTAKSRSAQAVN